MGSLIPEDSEPVVVSDLCDRVERSWQDIGDTAWSFGYGGKRLFASVHEVEYPNPQLPQRNSNGAETVGPQGVTVPSLGPVTPPARRFGKRAWRVLAQWEGVVEEVNGHSFRVRLTPLAEGGRPDFTRTEFAEFGFDELAYEAEQELIAPNVGIYWTVGRRKDELGTVSNESFVRIRRSGPPSALRRRLAAVEVAALLAEADREEE